MPIRLILRLTTLLVPAAIVLACTNGTSPADNRSTGTFTLVSADDQTLPAAVFDGVVSADPSPPFHLRIIATSGSLTLDANGHYEQRVEHDTIIDGVKNGRVTRADRGECSRTGTQLQCFSNFLEGVEFTATIVASKITIAQDLAGEGHVATYRYNWTSAQ